MLWDNLGDVLNEVQKKNKISNIFSSLRLNWTAINTGYRPAPKWKKCERNGNIPGKENKKEVPGLRKGSRKGRP